MLAAQLMTLVPPTGGAGASNLGAGVLGIAPPQAQNFHLQPQ